MRPVKQLRFTQVKSLSIEHRNGFNGAFYSSAVKKNDKEIERDNILRRKKNKPPLKILTEPEQMYKAPIRLSKEKCNDLKVLMRFCEEEGSRQYYENLLAANEAAVNVPVDDNPNGEPDF